MLKNISTSMLQKAHANMGKVQKSGEDSIRKAEEAVSKAQAKAVANSVKAEEKFDKAVGVVSGVVSSLRKQADELEATINIYA